MYDIYVRVLTLISFFLHKIFFFLLDKLRKRCHKFTHILQRVRKMPPEKKPTGKLSPGKMPTGKIVLLVFRFN